jgi:hypothetical protein
MLWPAFGITTSAAVAMFFFISTPGSLNFTQKRSAIVVVLFHDFAIDHTADMKPSYILVGVPGIAEDRAYRRARGP